MKLIMTGLDHKRSSLDIREKFAVTKEKTQSILTEIQRSVGSCVIISTCNRTELYVSVGNHCSPMLSRMLCGVLDRDFSEYGHCFTEKSDRRAMEHLCRVASGLDSQILGDDQIITQVREALEFSRGLNCTDSYLETAFKLAIQAAKEIKTNILLKSIGASTVPGKSVEKLRTLSPLAGQNAVVIGNGKMGRLVAELLIRENVNVTVTLREYTKGTIQIPAGAATINYSERYQSVENADIVVSATTSPHFTLCHQELSALAHLPGTIVDLALPRDVEPSVRNIPGLTLLGIDDIADENVLPVESVARIDEIIEEHIRKYFRWLSFKVGVVPAVSGGAG